MSTGPQSGRDWSPENDEDLRVMLESRSDISAISEELERTERAILDCVRVKGLREK